MRLISLTAVITLGCGNGIFGKSDDTGGTGVVGPGSCHVEAEEEDYAMCFTFSGFGWSTGTAEDFCEGRSNSAVSIEWQQNKGCPGGYDGLCEIDAIPAFEHEAYIYGEGAENGKELCSLLGGTWSQ